MDEVSIRTELADDIQAMTGIYDAGLGMLSTRWLVWLHHYLGSGDVASEFNKRKSLLMQRRLSQIGVHV